MEDYSKKQESQKNKDDKDQLREPKITYEGTLLKREKEHYKNYCRLKRSLQDDQK